MTLFTKLFLLSVVELKSKVYFFMPYRHARINILIWMILNTGALRRSSLDPGARRLSLGTPAVPHRASDAFLDPVHAAILFRDARGVSFEFSFIQIFFLPSNIPLPSPTRSIFFHPIHNGLSRKNTPRRWKIKLCKKRTKSFEFEFFGSIDIPRKTTVTLCFWRKQKKGTF